MSIASGELTGRFQADPAHSGFRFSVTHLRVSTFSATFDDVAVEVIADEDGVRLHGTARADSVSIRTPAELREHVVHGADFLDAGNHPLITFRSDRVGIARDGTVDLVGELTIKAVTRPVTATGVFHPLVDSPFGRRAGLQVSTSIDRRDFGLTYQLQMPGGGDALGNEVRLTADVELVEAG